MSNIPIKPSRWYYVISLLVLIGGWSLFTWFLFKNIGSLTDSLTQIVVPGQWDITLYKTGNYTVFYEYRSLVGTKIYTTNESLSGLECVITSNTKGTPVALTPASVNSTYSMGSRAGVSVLNFSIEQPGTYEFSCGYSQGKEGSEIVLAIGQGLAGKIAGTALGGLAIFFGSGLIAISIAVVTFSKRRKAKQGQ